MAEPDTLRVGLVLDDGLDKPDGVQQYILTIGSWLKKQGHIVHYLVGQTSRTDIDNVYSLSRNIRVRGNGNNMTIPLPTRSTSLSAVLEKEKFDVLHIQTPYSPFMGGRLIKLASNKTAIVGTFHILPNTRKEHIGTRLLGMYSLRSRKRIDTMLSVSSVAAKFAKTTYKLDSEVLPNVIDYKRFADTEPLKKYDDTTKTIMFLGRLVPRKGCQVLLKSIVELSKKQDIPKFRVVICGTGPLGSELKAFVRRHELEDIVEFVGFVEESVKPRYYASADITVFPSSGGESFGIVLLEAMASGKSVVLAGNNLGYGSVMSPQQDLLFDPHDYEMLTSKLIKFLVDDESRKQYAQWGHIYTKDYDVNVVGPKLVSIYKEALRKRNGK